MTFTFECANQSFWPKQMDCVELIVGEPITLEKDSQPVIFQAPNGIKYKVCAVDAEWHVSTVDAEFYSTTRVRIAGDLVVEKEQDGTVRVYQLGCQSPYIVLFRVNESPSFCGISRFRVR